MANKKNTFQFNLEWYDLLSELPPEERLAVYDAIVEYVRTGEAPTKGDCQLYTDEYKCIQLNTIAFLVFKTIKKDIDESQRIYKDKCLKLKSNIESRWKKKTKVNRCIQLNTIEQSKENEKRKESFPPTPPYKENKNINNNNTTTACAREEISLEEKIEEYKHKHPLWKADMARKFKIRPEDIDRHLDEFALDMRCKEYTVTKIPPLFVGWLQEKLNRQNNNPYGTDNRTNPERGWGPGGRHPKLPPNDLGYGLVED